MTMPDRKAARGVTFQVKVRFVLKDVRHFRRFHDDRAKPDSFADSRSHGSGAFESEPMANFWTKRAVEMVNGGYPYFCFTSK